MSFPGVGTPRIKYRNTRYKNVKPERKIKRKKKNSNKEDPKPEPSKPDNDAPFTIQGMKHVGSDRTTHSKIRNENKTNTA
jgi:hypothetical protein